MPYRFAAPNRLPLAAGLVALLLPGTALASDFGCTAEWLDLAVIGTAPLVALGAGLAIVGLSTRAAAISQLLVAAAVVQAGAVACASCPYGSDGSTTLTALGVLAVLYLPTAAFGAWRGRRTG